MNNQILDTDFDGVFRFSNWTEEDFTVLWNNKEYTFPAHTRSPIIIGSETLENIQAIRKKFAYKLAEREWYKGAEYARMKEMGNGRPPTRDDKVLEPLIQMCLDPLPVVHATVKDRPKEELNLRATKAVGDSENLNAAFAKETEDQNLTKLGVMPDAPIN